MKTKILPKSAFENGPVFEENWDFCLVTPMDESLEVTYFNIPDRNVVMLKQSANELNINPEKSILFCLTPQSELIPPNLGCFVAISKK
jgi:hypothetical protein